MGKLGRTSQGDMKKALELVSQGAALRQISREMNVPFATLRRHWTKKRLDEGDFVVGEGQGQSRNYSVKRVFTDDMETNLIEAIRSEMNYVDNLQKHIRKRSYEFAKENHLDIPKSWSNNGIADYEWVRYIKKKYQNIFEAWQTQKECKEMKQKTENGSCSETEITKYMTEVEDDNQYDEDIEYYSENENEEPRPTVKPDPLKRCLEDALGDELIVVEKSEMDRDDELVYARSTNESVYDDTIINIWGTKFKALAADQKLFAEKAINDILFEAQCGNLKKNSIKIID